MFSHSGSLAQSDCPSVSHSFGGFFWPLLLFVVHRNVYAQAHKYNIHVPITCHTHLQWPHIIKTTSDCWLAQVANRFSHSQTQSQAELRYGSSIINGNKGPATDRIELNLNK